MSINVIVVDTETGGLDPKKVDILSVGVVPIVNGVLGEGKSFLVRGERTTPKAMEINQINLVEHNKVALSREEALVQIKAYIKEVMGDNVYVACGHNLPFDLRFLAQLGGDVDKVFPERNSIDTKQLATFYKMAGFFPEDQSTALQSILKTINIPMEGEAHEALADAVATGKLLIFFLQKLITMAGAFLELRELMAAFQQEQANNETAATPNIVMQS